MFPRNRWCRCIDMRKPYDLTGARFGKLVVISATDKKFHRCVVWRCKCDCGNIVDVPAMYLASGAKTHCGCVKKKKKKRTWHKGKRQITETGKLPNKSAKDLTGQRFGKLIAIHPTTKRYRSQVIWECRCDCGNTVEASSYELLGGFVKSCECEKPPVGGKLDLRGKRFGHLTAIEETNERYNHWVVWKCVCDCGNIAFVPTRSLLSGATKSCGRKCIFQKFRNMRHGRVTLISKRIKKNQNGINLWLAKCDCGRYIYIDPEDPPISCGCTRKVNSKYFAICPGCNKEFQVFTDRVRSKTQQFCTDCEVKYSDRNYNRCAVCGKLFAAPPSDKTITCSPECKSMQRKLALTGAPHKWGEEAKERRRRTHTAEVMAPLQEKATIASNQSPLSGPFETNMEAKEWVLIDPAGEKHFCKNLMLWARKNCDLFGKEFSDKSAVQIAQGFYAVAATLAGKRKTAATTYKGWTLDGIPK